MEKIIILLLLVLSITSCDSRKEKDVKLTNDIFYRDSISNLINNGKITKDPRLGEYPLYDITDSVFYGMKFNRRNLFGRELASSINLRYSNENKDSVENKLSILVDNLNKIYGKPERDSIYYREDALYAKFKYGNYKYKLCHEYNWVSFEKGAKGVTRKKGIGIFYYPENLNDYREYEFELGIVILDDHGDLE